MLKFGNKGTEVKRLQRILKNQGYFKAEPSGNYLKKTEDAVSRFQMTHLGPDGKYLTVDGIAGDNTWWALNNPSNSSQKSNIAPLIPRGLTPTRLKVLTIAAAEHQRGVREIPDGSNWGDGVKKYGGPVPERGKQGWPWCCLFVSWVVKEATGKYPFKNRKEASTWQAWQYSEENDLFTSKARENYQPTPGDIFLMQYRREDRWTRTGHIGFVLRVGDDGFNTLEGNTANRVKCGYRTYDQDTIIGWIDPYLDDERSEDFERGIIEQGDLDGISTR